MHVQVHCAIIEYQNGKAKPANYLVQLVDLFNPNYEWQERFSEWQEVVSDHALARAIGFYNIYHQMWN